MVYHDATGAWGARDDGQAATIVHDDAAGERGPGGGWDATRPVIGATRPRATSAAAKEAERRDSKLLGKVDVRKESTTKLLHLPYERYTDTPVLTMSAARWRDKMACERPLFHLLSARSTAFPF